ncbi:hypothetical protein H7U37_07995 [Pseudoflavonifractor phocaeensis]|uniref:phage tail protein n=1 Tax=Pseudoflavonifractor phocaeensis TaxID=1870988 RepID=UPI0019599344|nr:hypothetical protein [Pseudoflavonifractor phocaeensis]MBM6938462.1 hypothetical protein [Pseudoflavonifractor phocaeensis]
MADGKVTIDTSLNTKGFDQGVKGLERGLGGMKSALLEIGKTVAAVVAAGQLLQFGKECIELGSDVAEVQNVVDVAFGDMAGQVETFANQAITNFGMSTLAAKKTASTYMSMARGMGIAMDSAAEMSLALTGLSGDVASFYNITQEEAAYKLQSVLTGETESLKELGVVMTQTNLQQYAMQHGMNANIQSMTQAEQVALRYAYVTDRLALASGDFIRTQDSWANQTRILSMQWQEFMSVIGQALTTILLPAVKLLNQIVGVLINAANALNAALTAIFGGAQTQIQQTQAAVGGVSSGIGEAVENQDALTDATKATNKAQQKTLAGFDQLNKMSGPAGASAAGGGGGVSSGGSASGVSGLPAVETETEGAAGKFLDLMERLRAAVEPFRASFASAFASIQNGASALSGAFFQAWQDIKTLGSPLYDWFSGDFTTFLNQFITTFGNTMGGLLDTVGMVFSDLWSLVIFPAVQKWAVDILPALTEFGTEVLSAFDVLFGEIKGIFDLIWSEAVAPALQMIQKIWSDVWDSIIAAWEKHGKPIFDKLKEAVSGTAQTLKNAWETICKPVWDKIMDVVSELWDEHVKPLWDHLLDFAGSLAELALNIYNNFILPIVNWFIDKFGPVISDVLGGAIDLLGDLLGAVIDGASWIIEKFTAVTDFLSDVFSADWKQIFENLVKIIKAPINTMIGMVEKFVNFFILGINKVIDALNLLRVDVPDWVPGVGGNSFGLNIPRVPELKLPRLATGAVIPPNQAFLAVLGDQKSGTNIEAPLSTIEQAVENVLSRRGYGQEITLRLVSDRGFVRHLKLELDKESQRRGVRLVRGGAY